MFAKVFLKTESGGDTNVQVCVFVCVCVAQLVHDHSSDSDLCLTLYQDTDPLNFFCVFCQCAESQSQTAVFLPEFALSPQGSFMESATEDQFLTYRYDDQVGHTLFRFSLTSVGLQKLLLVF